MPFAVIGALGIDCLLARLGQIRMCHKRALAWGGTSILAGGILFAYAMDSDFLSLPIRNTDLMMRELLRLLAMVLMTLGVLLFYIRSERPKKTAIDIRLAQVALILFIVFDVGSFCKKYLVFGPYEGIQRFPTEWVKSEIGAKGRLLVSPEVPQINNCVYGRILTAGGYDPFQVGEYVDYFRAIGLFEENQIPDGWSPNLGSAEELGITHVLTTQQLSSQLVEPDERNGPFLLFRMKETRPIVEFQASDSVASSTTEPISFGWNGGKILISGTAPEDGDLLIRNVYMPGWFAEYDNGDRVKTDPAEPFWQRVPIQAGDFEIGLRYHPDSWRWGVRFFWSGLLLTLIFSAWLISKTRKEVHSHETS